MRVATVTLALFLPLVACGGDAAGPGAPVETIFVVPASVDELAGLSFFDHPFPSDVRRSPDGKVRFAGWPNPTGVRLLDDYIHAADGLLSGFSPVSAVYLRFGGAIDEATLPADPPSSLAPDASVQIVDVDPTSPEHGQRRLAQVRFQRDEGVYVPAGTLAVMPMIGAPLRPNTKYAVVVTSRLRAQGGGAIAPSRDLAEVLGQTDASDRTRAAHDLFAPAIAELTAAGVPKEEIVHLSVFTTNDPTEETFAVLDDVAASTPAPTARDFVRKDDGADYTVYEGMYGPSPNYQAGTPPFSQPEDGGSFVFEDGKPKLQGTLDLRFALAVPDAGKCAPPPAGYPIVLYAHGTGGDYRSFLGDGTARSLARQCLASMGIDQVLHGTRPGAPAPDDPQRETKIDIAFFNFENLLAARTNGRQAAVDVVQQARLFAETKTTIPASISKTGAEIAIDGSRVVFFGHSQGSLNGPLFLAGSDLARGGVLSGAGGDLGIGLLEKTKPVDIPALLRTLTRLAGDRDPTGELDLFHPVITLVQTLMDVADPINYASRLAREPRPGGSPKSLYQTEGIAPDGSGDNFAPPRGIEIFAVAMGLPRISPGVRPIEEAAWTGLGDVTLPPGGLSGNLAGGRATGALAQFVPPPGTDGHFVVFHVPEAQGQAARFCRSLADDPVARITP